MGSGLCAGSLTKISRKEILMDMDTVINFICGTAEDFTPQVVCGLILFCSVFECIGNIAYALTSVGKGR